MNDKQPDVTIKAKTPEESAALQANMKRWEEEKQKAAATPTPKGFIEVTKRGTSNPVEKVLVAVHSISLVENFDWVENEPYSKLTVQISQYGGVAYALDVLESYDALKQLIAGAY